jgi:hypothetical protein
MEISSEVSSFYKLREDIFCSGLDFSSVFPKLGRYIGKAQLFINILFTFSCNLFPGLF